MKSNRQGIAPSFLDVTVPALGRLLHQSSLVIGINCYYGHSKMLQDEGRIEFFCKKAHITLRIEGEAGSYDPRPKHQIKALCSL